MKMNKLIAAVALVALASTAMVGTVSAGPGKPGPGSMIGNQSPGINIQFQQPGAKPGSKGGVSYGGDAASPGDAFYPDAGAQTCDGVIKYKFDESGVLVPFCIL
jgi:hypothetical protein